VFHENAPGGVVIERQPGAVHHAQTGGMAGNLSHQGGFTKTHLTDALAEALISRQPAYSTSHASRKLAERDVGELVGGVQGEAKLSKMRLSFKGNMLDCLEIKNAVQRPRFN
jgi:hypothetical protein